MKILWVVNQPTPEIAEKIGVRKFLGGGWMIKQSEQLAKNHELCIAFLISGKYQCGKVNGIQYIAIPSERFVLRKKEQMIKKFENIIEEFKPDVIHIWGTEYIHSYIVIKACEKMGKLDNTVISIQGLVSVYAKHFMGYIEDKSIKIPTLIDLYEKNSIMHQRKSFIKRGEIERKTIRTAHNVIGRTDWDKACTEQINPQINYHFCNETLRDSFYKHSWNIDKCEKYSIFISQCNYPIKGFHHVLEAARILKEKWDNIKIYSTGRNFLKKGISERIRDEGYQKYLRKLIYRYGLQDNVFFLGGLKESDMCDRFLKSHVFVSASSIENSPNSVGEAMIMGVPVVSSDVGGVKNMLEHNKEGFIYPADEPYMLAYYIDKIFSDDKLACTISYNEKIRAKKTHDQEKNLKNLLEIYEKLRG